MRVREALSGRPQVREVAVITGNKHEYSTDRFWGSALITLGVVMFAVVGLLAIGMIRDPGGYYDDWVPADEVTGPEASYDWSSSGLGVRFSDSTEIGDAPIERWDWDFGDGDHSDERNPTHTFASGGEWNVTLDVVDENGQTSQAEGTIETEPGEQRAGDGSIGLADLADKVVDTVERSAKGGWVVALVIGLFIVLTMIGGRLVRYGVRVLRPDPDKIKVKLRPKQLELDIEDRIAEQHRGDAEPPPAVPPAPRAENEQGRAVQREEVSTPA